MNPYQQLPEQAFWKTAIASKNMFDIGDLWNPKFQLLQQHKIATFGSCFAQHIGLALQKRAFSWLNTEPAPAGLSKTNCKVFSYDVFSCRTGNIYTTSLLKQWVEWALLEKMQPVEYWQKNDRFYDPFRPNIEPNGFESIEEMRLSRQQAISSFKLAIKRADVFVFTLGLTESWFNKEYGYEYPMCPGTAAGEFDSEQHVFKNQKFADVLANLSAAISLMRQANKKLRIILTVSPVPLTATNSGSHVLLATMASKSVLRAVAGQLAEERIFIDYFPSYEIINSPPFKGVFFEPNQRNVNSHGVDLIMDLFFQDMEKKFGEYPIEQSQKALALRKKSPDELVCEEELLAAFGKKGLK
ncbi:MAG: GSCFA domain-containing protein [Methylovulum sp.]|nr:GSCFA domain-containing protein [Methylovulum sp.]